jgi:CBS domain-containing protein
MKSNITAAQIMTTNVIVANLYNKFSQIMEFFTVYKIQHLPVAFDDELTGIISVNDFANYLSKRIMSGAPMDLATLDEEFKVSEVMTRNPVTVGVDDSLEKILEILEAGKFQAVPVVKDGLVHGIVTNKDLVRVYNWHLESI